MLTAIPTGFFTELLINLPDHCQSLTNNGALPQATITLQDCQVDTWNTGVFILIPMYVFSGTVEVGAAAIFMCALVLRCCVCIDNWRQQEPSHTTNQYALMPGRPGEAGGAAGDEEAGWPLLGVVEEEQGEKDEDRQAKHL